MECSSSYLIRAECLPEVCILEESCNWQNVGAGVHHDEEEHATEVHPGQGGIILHDQVQQRGYLLDQHRVKGQEQLEE